MDAAAAAAAADGDADWYVQVEVRGIARGQKQLRLELFPVGETTGTPALIWITDVDNGLVRVPVVQRHDRDDCIRLSAPMRVVDLGDHADSQSAAIPLLVVWDRPLPYSA